MKKVLWKKATAVLLGGVMCLSLAGCGGSGSSGTGGSSAGSNGAGSTTAAAKAETEKQASSEESITIKVNTSWGENSSVQDAALKFADLVSEKSGGRITAKVYPSNQLASGNQQTAVEMVQMGDIEVSMFGMTVLSFLDDRLAVVNMPFLINSYDEADQLIFDESAESRKMLDSILEENQLTPLAFGEAGFRQITNNKKEIKAPADLSGLKIRVLGTCPMFFDLYNALGANPTAMNMSEVFTSLQQGVIDGQENAADTIGSYKVNEVQKYMTCWNGVYDAVAFVASPVFVAGLSAEDYQMICDCAKEAMAFQVEEVRAQEAELVESFCGTMTVTELTDDERSAFKTAIQPVYDTWYDKIGADVMGAFGYTK